MDHKEFLETWFQRVWAEEDLDAITELMTSKAPVQGFCKVTQIGSAEFRGFAELMLKHISNVRISLERHIQDGQWSSGLIHIAATNAMTGEPVSFSGQVMVRIFDYKIMEAYNHIDFIDLFEQLGQMPPDSMARCLSGEVIR